jgi:hypothetical protein
LVTVPPTVKVVPDIDDAVPDALEIDGSLEIPVPEIDEFDPCEPAVPELGPPLPPPPTTIVYSEPAVTLWDVPVL